VTHIRGGGGGRIIISLYQQRESLSHLCKEAAGHFISICKVMRQFACLKSELHLIANQFHIGIL
jgi:hypothetical protein